MNQISLNKNTVLTCYKRVLGQLETSLVDELMLDSYIQHSPMLRTGKAGFLEALEYFKKMPKVENAPKPLLRVIAEGDFVAVHWSVSFGGSKAILDLYRLENGKLAEHWDAIQPEPLESMNGNKMTDGTIDITNIAETASNKKSANEFYEQYFLRGKKSGLEEYVHANLIQHAPEISNGADGLARFLDQTTNKITKVHRVLAEGDFVLIQSEGKMADDPAVFYTIFRFEAGKIAEHWSVQQVVPKSMLHDNGMI
jgi:predicted SnoaL-like aldol condensation-catalyzing enzyme